MVNAPRYISTGRGGAANLKAISNITHEPEDGEVLTRVATQASLGIRFGTGRGGAGNILPAGSTPLLDSLPSRELKSQGGDGERVVRTGRGGAGNVWASRVPKIDADLGGASQTGERKGMSRRGSSGSVISSKSEPGFGSVLTKMRRRFSSFGTEIN